MAYGDEVKCKQCGTSYSPTVHGDCLCTREPLPSPPAWEMDILLARYGALFAPDACGVM